MNDYKYPIDAVYTWVDGNDPEWQNKKEKVLNSLLKKTNSINETSISANRFQDNDELKYSLRSLERFASWITKVYVITDNQSPSWINHDNITIIDHTKIFPKEAKLPIFNSTPIEMCIHRIQNLTEHFISLNDDFMIGKEVRPEDFFTKEGKPKIWAVKFSNRHKKEFIYEELENLSIHSVRDIRARRLIIEKFNTYLPIKVRHYPRSMKRSIMYEIWDTFQEVIEHNLSSSFRSRNDTIIVPALFSYYSIATKNAKLKRINGINQIWHLLCGRIRHIGATTGDSNFKKKLKRIDTLKPLTFCLNDGDKPTTNQDRNIMKQFLQKKFPNKSKYEK